MHESGTNSNVPVDRQSTDITHEQFRRFFELSEDIFAITTLEARVLKINPALEALLGFTPVEVIGSYATDLIHPDDVTLVCAHFQELSAGAGTACVECRLRCKDGTFKWFCWSSRPDLQFGLAYCVGKDNSRRKVAEFDVLRLANIIEYTSDAVIGADQEGRINIWNRSATRLYGFSPDEVLGQSAANILGDHSWLTNHTRGPIETTQITKFRKEVPVAISVYRLTAGRCSDTQPVWIIRDLTPLKQIEKRIHDFHSAISHELRTPLSSVRGALGLIEGGLVESGSDEASELIGMARISSDRLIRLINNLLDLEKIEAGKIELNVEPLDVAVLVSRAVADVKYLAAENGQSIVTKISSSSPVWADADKALRILDNLLSNALKFSPANSKVEIVVEENDDMIKFSIIDSGEGIPADKLKQLFGRFEQLDYSDKRPHQEGTGLGLAIAKALVEQQCGSIGVETKPAEGSKFFFTLPAVPTRQQRPILSEAPAKRILLVEDDHELSKVLVVQLKQEGYTVSCADTLAAARNAIENCAPDLLLLDLLLPDGNGLDLILELAEKEKTAELPVIVSTAVNSPAGYHHKNVYEWLAKPYVPTHLSRAIRKALMHSLKKRVYIVGGNDEILESLKVQFNAGGIQCLAAGDPSQAMEEISETMPDIVLVDTDIVGMEICLRQLPDSISLLVLYSFTQLQSARVHQIVDELIAYACPPADGVLRNGQQPRQSGASSYVGG